MKLFSNIVLFAVAIVLFVVVSPTAILWSVGAMLLNPRHLIKTLSNLFFTAAKSIDMLSNAIYYLFFNSVMIRKDNIHSFGDEKETISRVLGINKSANNLTKFGGLISSILDKIDPKHVEKASEDTHFSG